MLIRENGRQGAAWRTRRGEAVADLRETGTVPPARYHRDKSELQITSAHSVEPVR